MDLLLTLIRIVTAIIAPLVALALIILTYVRLRGIKGEPAEEGQSCLRCERTDPGGVGLFHYAESVGDARDRAAKKQLTPTSTPILGSETHFICDACARRYIRTETIQIILLMLPYPLYLYVIIPLFAENGVFANFLIETMLVVLSVAAFTSVFDLFRAVRKGADPLAEARDRVAIGERKRFLGKQFSYYTQMGSSHLQD